MGGIRVNLLGVTVLCAAVLALPPRKAVAQASGATVAAAERIAADGAAVRRKRTAAMPSVGEQRPSNAPEPEAKRNRHIGKMHNRFRKHAKHLQQADPDDAYVRFTQKLEADYGLKVLLSPTILTQLGNPDGGPVATQVVLSPDIQWEAFKSPIGDGTFHFSYTSNRYYAGGQSAASLTARLNLLSPINDTPFSNRMFNQLTYSHDFPGQMLLIGVGQFTLSNYDTNKYAGNQQQNFINYSLSQNATQTYPTASLGAFAQVTPILDTLDFVIGFQDANNISGNNIQTSTAGDGPYTTLAYAQWTPKITGLGDAQYSILYYHQPAVLLQPAVSDGWSLNASQDLNENWGLFLRANATTGPLSPIKDSVGAGVVVKDVLGRNHDNDQIGVGISRNATNMDFFAGQNVRASEWLVEVYWNTLIWRHFIVGPDVQVYINPALNPGQSSAQVYTLRLTGLF
jgi:hypothetical protein